MRLILLLFAFFTPCLSAGNAPECDQFVDGGRDWRLGKKYMECCAELFDLRSYGIGYQVYKNDDGSETYEAYCDGVRKTKTTRAERVDKQ